MVPYTHTPNQSNSANPQGGAGGDRAGELLRKKEQKMQMENRLRIMKNDVVDKQRTFHALEQDVRTLEMSLRHVDEETGRIESEYRRLEQGAAKTETESKSAAVGYREKDMELRHKEDEVRKSEHEIDLLKAQITERERKIMLVKQDIGKLMKEKEDFRRTHELDHFSSLTESEHAREKSSRVQLLVLEKKRKELDVSQKQQRMNELRRYVIDKEQDIMQLDAQLKRLEAEMR